MFLHSEYIRELHINEAPGRHREIAKTLTNQQMTVQMKGSGK